MSRRALLDALAALDFDRVREVLRAEPELLGFKDGKGLNLLELGCWDPAANGRKRR
jgi:hypothetical protein